MRTRTPTVKARQEGFEPPTNSLEGCRSIHLSYWRLPVATGHPAGHLDHLPKQAPLRLATALPNACTNTTDRGGRIRTGDLLLPKQARYRATLRPVHQSGAVYAAHCRRSTGSRILRQTSSEDSPAQTPTRRVSNGASPPLCAYHTFSQRSNAPFTRNRSSNARIAAPR